METTGMEGGSGPGRAGDDEGCLRWILTFILTLKALHGTICFFGRVCAFPDQCSPRSYHLDETSGCLPTLVGYSGGTGSLVRIGL